MPRILRKTQKLLACGLQVAVYKQFWYLEYVAISTQEREEVEEHASSGGSFAKFPRFKQPTTFPDSPPLPQPKHEHQWNPLRRYQRYRVCRPPHVPTLEIFTYLVVLSVHGSTATVRKTGPDGSADNPEFDVKTAILHHRVVDESGTDLWPGSYVGHPIAFELPSGPASGQWAYGIVTGYNMRGNTPFLHVRHSSNTLRFELLTPLTVIVVDRLNFALQTGATVNAMVLNGLELVDR
ncbi:unnamed protein product [Phytophthora lilii]|uniref:Unnamed protein product n=1 Tax=Phytophthora lilii TaxID=2077276 RepID=A0A9W6XBW4_9STRA|nr:unnamed protein product [Phytophthora lilii]